MIDQERVTDASLTLYSDDEAACVLVVARDLHGMAYYDVHGLSFHYNLFAEFLRSIADRLEKNAAEAGPFNGFKP